MHLETNLCQLATIQFLKMQLLNPYKCIVIKGNHDIPQADNQAENKVHCKT